MGCAPSITVSQSGVVYCRDSDESNSPKPSSFSQQQHVHITTTTGADIDGALPVGSLGTAGTSTTTVTVYHGGSDRRGTISIEAETQTSRSSVTMKGEASEVLFGPMKLTQPTMQSFAQSIKIMLVFSREDAQSDGFWWAADKGGYKCNIVRNSADALECFMEKQHDLIIIDHRHAKTFDALALCRSIRATKISDHTVIVGVTKKSSGEKDEASIMPILNAGFNRRYQENPHTRACLNELIQLELGEVRSQFKLRVAGSLFAALENCSDAVEITGENNVVQYVNSTHQQLTGYSSEEVLGKEADHPRGDKNKPELMDTIFTQLRKGKVWEGMLYTKKKNGDNIPQNVKITPVISAGGRVRHHVFNKRSPSSATINQVLSQEIQHLEKVTSDLSNGGHAPLNRRQSVARIHSMTIEAPITKVINIINAAQENSPVTVVQALDRVLEILRSSELYHPQNSQVKEEDQMTNDLVGGLMTPTNLNTSLVSLNSEHGTLHGSGRRRLSSEIGGLKSSPNQLITASPPTHLNQAPPEVLKILEDEHSWKFNILELERVTAHRPLIYLGLKTFGRFNVCSFLGINETVLRNWLQVIEANYHTSNPYHNSTHAADVLQATAFFLGKARLKEAFEPSDEVAALIAATVHDVDHPGKTNSFLCNAGSELAVLYNDTAVLESHHSALAFQLTTREDRCNLFKELDRDDFRTLRHTIIDMVLATEMNKHFEHLSKFVNSINKPINREVVDPDSSSIGSTGGSTPDSFHISTPENRALIRRMLIKCADVCNPTRPIEMCKEWARRISQEYFNQTDEEKKRGLPVVMPVFDRDTCSVPKSQTSFVDYFIMDMFDAWDGFVDCHELIEQLHYNYKYWKGEEEKEKGRKEKEANDAKEMKEEDEKS